jgi:hypothetical protein
MTEDTRPGRNCPLAYRYPPASMNRNPEIEADALYIVGGLYGNVEALETVREMAAAEREAALAFNGDFHWFDIARADFVAVNATVLGRHAIRGNVETELAAEESGAGCGCAYPADVSDSEVSRSNRILESLRETARVHPEIRQQLGALPMNLVARVGGARVGIVHGDAASLAGWGFAHDRLDERKHQRWIENAFRDAQVQIFASSHTCLPAMRTFDFGSGEVAVANNGAAGMPNFAGRCSGVLTRIATTPYRGERLYAVKAGGVYVEAIEVAYDRERWARRFLASWPENSPAHESYWRRLSEGPRFELDKALPRAA